MLTEHQVQDLPYETHELVERALNGIDHKTAKDCAEYGWRDLLNAKLIPEQSEFEIVPPNNDSLHQQSMQSEEGQINSSVDSEWKYYMCQPWNVDFQELTYLET